MPKISSSILLVFFLTSGFTMAATTNHASDTSFPILSDATAIPGVTDASALSGYSKIGLHYELLTSPSSTPAEARTGLLQVFDKHNNRMNGILWRGFRTVTVKWIDDRRIYLQIDLGRMEEVLCLYDAKSGKILSSTLINLRLD